MKFRKSESTSSPLITVQLNQGESIKLEPGAMVYHNGKINLEGKTNGSLGGALMKKCSLKKAFSLQQQRVLKMVVSLV